MFHTVNNKIIHSHFNFTVCRKTNMNELIMKKTNIVTYSLMIDTHFFLMEFTFERLLEIYFV